MTNLGELDTLVTIRSCIIGKTDRGAKTYSFPFHSKVWAKVSRSVDEVVANQNLEALHTVTLTMYKIEEMTTRWQVVLDGKPYEIVSIDPIERMSRLCEVSIRAIDG